MGMGRQRAGMMVRQTGCSAWIGAGLMHRLAVLLVCAVTACAPVYQNHGYAPTDAELAVLVVGVDDRDTVTTAIGRPTALGLLNDVGWYYVQSRWKLIGGRDPVEIDREVVAITFDEGGIVANIERFGLEAGQVVPLSRRVTETNIKGASVLRQLFGNIGRLSADSILK